MRARRIPLAFVAALLSSALISTPAQAIPLTTLVTTGGTIQQGDKLFSNFDVPSLLVAIGNVTPVSYSGIDVQGITVGGQDGLRFSGPFSAVFAPSGSLALVTYHFTFDVTVLDPSLLLHDVSHSYVVTHSGNGSPFQTRNVTATTDVRTCPELFCLDPSDFEVSLHSTISPTTGLPLPSPTAINVSLVLPHDVSFLRVENDVFLSAGSLQETDPQSVSFPYIDVIVSQTAIPEPASLLLVGLGLTSLAWLRRRR
jgi:PEP-CTERM motif